MVDDFLKKHNAVLSFGGDGTLLTTFHDVYKDKKVIYPVRNYATCNKHGIENLKKTFMLSKVKDFYPLESDNNFALSEITIRNADLTTAIRFELYINDILYASNIIGDGIIVCTTLGSTGYFRSVTNTFFQQGIGIGFINTTQHINNMILSSNSRISIKLTRGNANIAYDNIKSDTLFKENELLLIKEANEPQKIIGYDHFMCPECRKFRHGIVTHDVYNILNK